ncbi:hypothetical protein [Lewinella sp. 4G2]|uniref:hypothetical protein n=1 Tax=Lewinella sp. 4G2 TaxID=1803372 RepID=UPI0007B4606E|nr:hypothetical protein [Lewinella sp. 4G2]OAV45127.1 hypothetical protein A3850_011780 [Lewinella sp. 4G2]
MNDDYNKIEQMKKDGQSLLETVKYIRKKYRCSINDANEIVLNSPAWIHYKDEFYSLQDSFHSLLDQVADEIEEEDGKVSWIFNIDQDKD